MTTIVYRILLLEDDEEIHVSEKQAEEEYLGYELKPDLKFPFEVEGVEQFEEYSADHVEDGDDDRDLHLETVDEDEVVACHSPNGINSKGIDTIFSVSVCHLSVSLDV